MEALKQLMGQVTSGLKELAGSLGAVWEASSPPAPPPANQSIHLVTQGDPYHRARQATNQVSTGDPPEVKGRSPSPNGETEAAGCGEHTHRPHGPQGQVKARPAAPIQRTQIRSDPDIWRIEISRLAPGIAGHGAPIDHGVRPSERPNVPRRPHDTDSDSIGDLEEALAPVTTQPRNLAFQESSHGMQASNANPDHNHAHPRTDSFQVHGGSRRPEEACSRIKV